MPSFRYGAFAEHGMGHLFRGLLLVAAGLINGDSFASTFPASTFSASNIVASTAATLTSTAPDTQAKHLQEIIVTGVIPTVLFEMPRSASVISALDIETSGAASVPELIAREANVTLSSFTGNDKFSKLDIRGSGDTSSSNVLLLVDGIRSNLPDLSGADFSLISLQQVERIEVIRGANTVRYGSGASHGVINIITKKIPPGVHSKSSARYGSYNHVRFSQDIGLANQQHSLFLNASYSDSDGYRKHNALRNENYAASWQTRAEDFFSVGLSSRAHRDNFQLPGPLARSAIDNGSTDRKSADSARTTEGKTSDRNQLLQLFLQPAGNLWLRSNLYYRERDNDFVMSTSASTPANLATTPGNQQDRIYARSSGGELLASWSPNRLPLTLNSGLGYAEDDYSRTNGGRDVEDRLKNQGDLVNLSGYIHAELQTDTGLRLSVGYRRESAKNKFLETQLVQDESSSSCTSTDVDIGAGTIITIIDNCALTESTRKLTRDNWRNEAYEYGIVWQLAKQLNIYTSYARTFRNPNIDELALPPDNNQQLEPQHAERLETGTRFNGSRMHASLALFHSRTVDEIIFRSEGLTTITNRNFSEPIKRRGIELQANLYRDRFKLNGNLGYTQATTPDDRRIPLVPRVNAAVGFEWATSSSSSLHVNTQYVSDRLDGNSFEQNNFQKLSSHVITNAHLRWLLGDQKQSSTSVYLGSNNLFNKKYFSSSYSELAYPAPQRSIYGGITVAL
ncbi:MAG: TonB-dependent receptor [Pseudomonadales bacterium]